MTCIITGCALNDLDLTRTVWGDLHQIGNCYVFNACLVQGEAAWQDGELAPDTMRVIEFKSLDTEEFFERRGTFTIPKSECRLNPRATEFLQQWGHL